MSEGFKTTPDSNKRFFMQRMAASLLSKGTA
jgi:hypothetical protein